MLDSLFDAVSRETLENDGSIVYALDGQLNLVYANPAWDDFAYHNTGQHLTRDRLQKIPVLQSIGQRLRPFYSDLFHRVLERGETVEHIYQCSSPDVYREFRMRVLPLRDGAGVVTVHSLADEHPHKAPAALPDPARYTATDGMITMCSHCRRTQRRGTEMWEWVPSFVVDQPANLTHGLCAICLEYYYLSGNARRANNM